MTEEIYFPEDYDEEKYYSIEPFCPCDNCQDPDSRTEMAFLETNFLFGDYEEEFEFSVNHTNLEDRVNRIHPELSCSWCPPNKSENEGRTGKYSNYFRRKKPQKNRQKQLQKARKFKEYQRENDNI